MKSRFIIYIPTDTREATAASFARVAGVPLFLRTALALAATGERSFCLVSPLSHRRQVLKLWQKITKGRDLHLNLVLMKENHRLRTEELAEIKQNCEESAYLLNANYVVPNLSSRILPTIRNNPRIKPNEVLILKPASRRMAILGFHLGNLDPVIAGAQKYPLTMEECFNMIVGDRNRHYLSEGEDGLIIQKFSEIKIAEHMLTENIRTNTQTFVAREINKRISLPISLWLAKFRVTPNTITAVNICIGLCAGIGAAGRTYTGVLLGAILFQTASVIDGCDGEVAKLTFRTSKFGQYIDSVSDNLSLAAFLTGMMIHQYRIGHSYAAFIFGGLLITGALAILALMSDYLKRNSDSASFVTFDKEFLQKLTPENTPALAYHLIKYFKIFFKKDFFSLTFLIFAIFGILHWWFYIITIGVWVGTFVLMSLRKMWVGGKAGTL